MLRTGKARFGKAGITIPALMVLLLFVCFTAGCDDKEGEGQEILSGDSARITCELSCRATAEPWKHMGWEMICQNEIGIITEWPCRPPRTHNDAMVRRCNGTIHYDSTGDTYEWSSTEDWANGKFSVTVQGRGECYASF